MKNNFYLNIRFEYTFLMLFILAMPVCIINPNYILGYIVFFGLLLLIFERQKLTISKGLASKILPSSTPYNLYFFQQGHWDFFQSFIIVSEDQIVICHSYLPIQVYFNNILNYRTELDVSKINKINKIEIKSHQMFIILNNVSYKIYQCTKYKKIIDDLIAKNRTILVVDLDNVST